MGALLLQETHLMWIAKLAVLEPLSNNWVSVFTLRLGVFTLRLTTRHSQSTDLNQPMIREPLFEKSKAFLATP
jgi:hypothetical protein